jgi:predicted ATPase
MDRYAEVRSGALLERDREVGRVRATVRAAGRRSGEALVVEGAAGIGKSRLLEQARAEAATVGVRVLDARATELERGFPYGVMRQLFERLLIEADDDERERWLAGAAGLASEVLTGALIAGSEAPRGPSAGDPGYAWQHGLYWLASNIAAEAPLVLVVDDLQWCDAPSLRALMFIARRLEDQPLALMMATRPPDGSSASGAAALLADPAVEVLRPAPLTASAVAELVAT